jgi:Prokaryotic metallothionein
MTPEKCAHAVCSYEVTPEKGVVRVGKTYCSTECAQDRALQSAPANILIARVDRTRAISFRLDHPGGKTRPYD